MNYLPKSRHKSANVKRASLLIVFFLIGAGLFSLIDNFIISTISPLWRAENRISRALGQGVDFFSSRQTLIRENADLKEKLASVEMELSSLYASQEQSRVLLELLGRTRREESVVASILTYPPQSPYDILVVDAGAQDRVVEGKTVFLPEGPELGVVSEVFSNTSKVKLFTTSGEETNAILERHNVPVVLQGIGAGNFKLVIPRDTEVEIGDRILSTRLTPSLLAVVEDIKVEPTDAFKEVLAKSPANIFNIRLVLIRP